MRKLQQRNTLKQTDYEIFHVLVFEAKYMYVMIRADILIILFLPSEAKSAECIFEGN